MKRKDLENQLDELNNFIYLKDGYLKEEIFIWLSKCIAFFSYLGISEVIIKKFIDALTPVHKPTYGMSTILSSPPIQIGPFTYSEKTFNYRLDKDLLGSGKIEEMYPLDIAFTTANYLLEQKAEEEKLVGKSFINAFKNSKKQAVFASLLKDLQKAYEDKNDKAIVITSIDLLDNILDLEPNLRSKNKISKKLSCLLSDKKTRDKFGVSKDFIIALDNSRLTRNIEAVHKKIPLKHNIPFLVSISCAHLVLMFLEITISKGNFKL